MFVVDVETFHETSLLTYSYSVFANPKFVYLCRPKISEKPAAKITNLKNGKATKILRGLDGQESRRL